MSNNKFWTSAENTIVAAVFAVAAFFVFFNLGANPLWHDEASSTAMARQLVNTGGFGGWTGRNLHLGLNGAALDANFNIAAYPPWPALPSALGLALFGETNFAVRFFHALLGALSFLLFYALLRMDLPAAHFARLRIFAFVCFALSAQALLFMRSGRYYADGIFFSVLAFYCYRAYWRGACPPAAAAPPPAGKAARGAARLPPWLMRLQLWLARLQLALRRLPLALERPPPWAWLALCALATVINFANHYAIGAAFGMATAAWHLLFYARQSARRHYAHFALAAAAAGGGCLLVLWAMGIIGAQKEIEFAADTYHYGWLQRRLLLAYIYFRDLMRYNWLPLWAAGWLAAETAWALCGARLLAWRAAWKNRGKKGAKKGADAAAAAAKGGGQDARADLWAVWRYLALVLLFLLFSALISVQSPAKHGIADSRYWVSALPFLALVGGGPLCRLSRLPAGWHLPAVFVGALVLLGSNLLAQPFAIANLWTKEKFYLTLPQLAQEVVRKRPTATEEIIDYLRQHAAQDDIIAVAPWSDYEVLMFYLDDKLIFCCALNEDSGLDKNEVDKFNIPIYENAVLPRWVATFDGAQVDEATYEKVFVTSVYPYPTRRPELEYRTFFELKEKEPKGFVFRLRDTPSTAPAPAN